MGEAKRRKENDPSFGKIPKEGKGIVISPLVTVAQDGYLQTAGYVHPVELRRAVLFWDRIARPTNNVIYIELSPDEKFLLDCGILREYSILVNNIEGGQVRFTLRYILKFSPSSNDHNRAYGQSLREKHH